MILVGSASYITEQVREDSRQSTVESLNEEDWEGLRQFHKHGDAQLEPFGALLLSLLIHSFPESSLLPRFH